MIVFKNKNFWIALFLISFFISIGSVSAEHTTMLKVYQPAGFGLKELSNPAYFAQSKPAELLVSLHVDDGPAQWLRYINLEIYNNSRKLVHQDRSCTWNCGRAQFFLDFSTWQPGSYQMIFFYEGNREDQYPRAITIIQMELII